MQVYCTPCQVCNPGYNATNSICNRCIEGAIGIVSFVKEFKPSTTVDLSTALQWMKDRKEMGETKEMEEKKMKEREEKKMKEIDEKMDFLESFVVALKEGIHTDILLQPGTGPAISTHRALLATKSEIFRTMLSNDACKASAEGSICLPELTHDDLCCLVDFLYSGNLPVHENLTNNDNIDEHYISLLIAADKYEIPLLKSVCESRILQSLMPGNALAVLELAFRNSSVRLREQALNVIVSRADNVLLSSDNETFLATNPHIAFEITRALLKNMKKA